MKKGFTLIELLVVVLIIGILSAIAVPQYNKTVMKSKMAEAITLSRTMAESVKRYQMENDRWPNEINDLDISVQGCRRFATNACEVQPKLANYDRYISFSGGVVFFQYINVPTWTNVWIISYDNNTQKMECVDTATPGKYCSLVAKKDTDGKYFL